MYDGRSSAQVDARHAQESPHGSSTPTLPEGGLPVLELDGVSKVFRTGGSGTVHALDAIRLSLGENELVSVVGPSGCGKSTLLSIAGGLTQPSAGRVLFEGGQLTEPSRKIGFMFQTPVLLPWRTVERNVLLPPEVFRADVSAYRPKARRWLELVGLSDFTDSYPWQLSGGMQQRVALARVLVYEARVLLMDEPFGALDEFTRETMNLELLRITREAQVAVLFVTHNISEAVFLGDRVVVMSPRPGRITGVVDVPFARPRDIELMQDTAFLECTAEVRRILRKGNA